MSAGRSPCAGASVAIVLAALACATPSLAQPFSTNDELRDALAAQPSLARLDPPFPVVTLLVRAPTSQVSGLLHLWTRPTTRLPNVPAIAPPDVLATLGMWVGVTNGAGGFVYLARAGDAEGLIVGETFDEQTGEIEGEILPPAGARDLMTRAPFVGDGGLVVFAVRRPPLPEIVVAVDYGGVAPPPPPQGRVVPF